jgi:hypothetical protein
MPGVRPNKTTKSLGATKPTKLDALAGSGSPTPAVSGVEETRDSGGAGAPPRKGALTTPSVGGAGAPPHFGAKEQEGRPASWPPAASTHADAPWSGGRGSGGQAAPRGVGADVALTPEIPRFVTAVNTSQAIGVSEPIYRGKR